MRVVYYEGLFSYFIGFLTRGLIKDLKDLYPEAKFEKRHWMSKKKVKADLVVGHSFGAYAAYKNSNNSNNILITLDCRFMPWSSYTKKAIAKNHFNFFQRKGLKGYKVYGAINTLIKDTTHTKLASNIEVSKKVITLLAEIDPFGR